MKEPEADERNRDGLAALAAVILLAVPLWGASLQRVAIPGDRHGNSFAGKVAPAPPPVEPLEVKRLSAEDARMANAAVPFSTEANPAARPFVFAGMPDDRERAIACLAAAQLYEAGDDPLGERAVAQVVLNRVRHPAFPKSVCGVVFQGAERSTGCQFTFTCDGALSRPPAPAAWDRAKTLAAQMLSGLITAKVGHATHYHTDWVVPYWSSSLDKIARVHTHLFFRWTGWWGTPPAFLRHVSGSEPKISQLAALSSAHQDSAQPGASNTQAAALVGGDALQMARAPITEISPSGKLTGGARLVATSPASTAFIVEIPSTLAQSDYPALARAYCSGRTKCRIMAWRAGKGTPKNFPIDPAALPNMIFSYIHNAGNGLQRILWNCDLIPQSDTRQCMRERVKLTLPAAPSPVIAAQTSPAATP